MKCAKCGRRIPDTAISCPYCHAPQHPKTGAARGGSLNVGGPLGSSGFSAGHAGPSGVGSAGPSSSAAAGSRPPSRYSGQSTSSASRVQSGAPTASKSSKGRVLIVVLVALALVAVLAVAVIRPLLRAYSISNAVLSTIDTASEYVAGMSSDSEDASSVSLFVQQATEEAETQEPASGSESESDPQFKVVAHEDTDAVSEEESEPSQSAGSEAETGSASAIASFIVPKAETDTALPTETAPTAEAQANAEAEPAAETQPTAEAEPTAEIEPAAEAETTTETQPTTETPSTTETQPAAETESESATSTQTASLSDLLQATAESFSTDSVDVLDRGITPDELSRAVTELKHSVGYDYVDYCSWSYRTIDGVDTVVDFSLAYKIDNIDPQTYAARMDTALNELLEGSESLTSDVDKVVFVYNKLVQQYLYDDAGWSCAYDVLVNKAGYCDGFETAFELALQRLGIPFETTWMDDKYPVDLVQVDGASYYCWLGRDAERKTDRLFCLCSSSELANYFSNWLNIDAASELSVAVPTGYYDLVASSQEELVSLVKAQLTDLLFDYSGIETDLSRYHIAAGVYDQAVNQMISDPALPSLEYNYSSTVLANGDETVEKSTIALTDLPDSEAAGYRSELQQALNAVLAQMDPSWSDYEKVLWIHDWLVRNVAYDSATQESGSRVSVSYSALGALSRHSAVCAGYAKAFCLVLQSFGIQCTVVQSKDMDHDWAMVCLDGVWYHVDVTWDDPVPDQGYDAEVSHKFFLVSDATIGQDHYGWTSDYTAPYDYYG